MALTSGTRLGPYEVIGAIGAGGMGEVYRARDTKLHRDVALKILPDSFAADPDRLSRFEREAQVLASLNHPNIAQIFGFEESSNVRALAMELVEGEDLSQRIARGPIPLDEALPIAKQIALALEAAHALGIVHRDLKPANIKLTADGHVKVLDFGLAKAITGDGAQTGADSSSPVMATMTSPAMTAMGMILGTAAYMAPEQARGRAIDQRADIWAFGCVLFEMLTARRPFAGEDMAETLASVVKEQPDLTPLPREVRRLVARCLEKDPKRRLRDIGDVWDLLDDQPGRSDAVAVPAAAPVRARLPWLLAAAAVLAAGAVSIVHFGEKAPTPVTARFEVAWPNSASPGAFAISPDGRHVALVAGGSIWLRPLDRTDAVRLEHTDGANYPFWSPNSEWIGFFAEGQLKKVSVAGGNPQRVCAAADGRGASWSPNGTIIFSATGGNGGLSRVPDVGGTATQVTTLSTSGSSDSHRYPQFLPDGEHFLFLYLASKADAGGVYVGGLDGSTPVRVREEQDSALFTTSSAGERDGYLLFRRAGTLMAQAFDPSRRQTSGAIFPVAENVGQGQNTGSGAFSVSASGTLAHGAGVSFGRRMIWVDRTGKQIGAATEDLQINSFALTRDERRLALGVTQSAALDTDIWIRSLPGGSPSKLTFGPAPGWFLPVWSPDGSELIYVTMDLAGLASYEIRRKRSDMTGKEETLLRADSYLRPWDWSADGKWLVYSSGNDDLWLLPMVGDHTPTQFTQTPEEESYAQLSTDGRWLAYAAGDRASPQVFVQPVPATGAKWLVSAGGGSQPRWRRDGKELYYRRGDGQLMAVPIAGASAALEHGTPQALFGSTLTYGNVERFTYQPSADGQKFLVVARAEAAIPQITVVLNWPGAKR